MLLIPCLKLKLTLLNQVLTGRTATEQRFNRRDSHRWRTSQNLEPK